MPTLTAPAVEVAEPESIVTAPEFDVAPVAFPERKIAAPEFVEAADVSADWCNGAISEVAAATVPVKLAAAEIV